jgi:uncharacterized protein YjiS (DUF1127 family)
MIATSEIEAETTPTRAGTGAVVAGPFLRWITRLRTAWRHRRDVEVLSSFDDHMLADIGLSRADLRDAMAGPRWRDPTALLLDRRRERRAGGRRVALRLAGRVVARVPTGNVAW